MSVRELRVVVAAEEYDAAVGFYRDVLGMREQAAFAGPGGAEVTILDAGRATFEIANPAQRGSSTRSRWGGKSRRGSGSRSRWTTWPG